MTVKDKINKAPSLRKVITSPYFEVHTKPRGARVVIIGAIGVSEVDVEGVLVKCHGVKLRINGNNISINVLERNTLELVGKVEDIKIINGNY